MSRDLGWKILIVLNGRVADDYCGHFRDLQGELNPHLREAQRSNSLRKIFSGEIGLKFIGHGDQG